MLTPGGITIRHTKANEGPSNVSASNRVGFSLNKESFPPRVFLLRPVMPRSMAPPRSSPPISAFPIWRRHVRFGGEPDAFESRTQETLSSNGLGRERTRAATYCEVFSRPGLGGMKPGARIRLSARPPPLKFQRRYLVCLYFSRSVLPPMTPTNPRTRAFDESPQAGRIAKCSASAAQAGAS